ncbi:MAG: acetate--CoA ligase family protein [Desulfosoma sp.]
MDPLFDPRSVAVVGVSPSPENLGKNIIKNLRLFGFRGTIYPIGPRGGVVEGYRVYESVKELPEPVDVAVILTPARFVPDLLAECGEIGVRWAVIQSGGFRESGLERMDLEKQVLDTASRYDIRFVGPNCLGVMDTTTGFSVPFIALPAVYRTGRTAIMAQSGGMGLSLAEALSTAGVGFGKFVSLGNKLNLDEVDYLTSMVDDPKTDILYFYLEDFKRGREFFEFASRSPKPIVLHKSNTSPLSRTIAQSHTAALAADDRLVDHLAKEAGVVRVRSVSEAVKVIKGFSLPVLRGRRLAVLSRSGGHAVVAADTCDALGFTFPPLADEVLNEVQRHARAGVIRLGNPLDLGDIYDLNVYEGLVEKVMRQPDIDGVVHIHVSHMAVEHDATMRLLDDLKRHAAVYRKPVAVVVEVPFKDRVALEREASYPFFTDVRDALEALSAQHWYYTSSKRARPSMGTKGAKPPWFETAQAWIQSRKEAGRQPLLHECFELLEILGMSVAPWRLVKSWSEVQNAAEALGYPVALKAVGSDLVHKSDQGAVVLGINDATALDKAWRSLWTRGFSLEGIVVQKMMVGSREMIVGAHRDPVFGSVVLVGMGGILVELLHDVSVCLTPLSSAEALEMIHHLRGASLLKGYRGLRPLDLTEVGEAVSRLSLFMDCFPAVREIDINPIIFGDQGEAGVAVDGHLLLEKV